MQVTVFDVLAKKISTASLDAAETACSDLSTDGLYVVAGTSILPLATGTGLTGIWRSKRIAFSRDQGFGWARVNAPIFKTGVVLRLYANGALFYTTPPILSREPVRLPAGRALSWELEVESADRVVSVALAQTAGELRGS